MRIHQYWVSVNLMLTSFVMWPWLDGFNSLMDSIGSGESSADCCPYDPFDLAADTVMEAIEIFVYYDSDSIEIPMEFDPQIQDIAA